MKLDRSRISILLLIFCGTMGIALWFSWNARHNSGIRFLPRRGPAQWIVYPSPFLGSARPRIELETKFRREFVLKQAPQKAQLSWCAFTNGSVALNDLPLVSHQATKQNWKDPRI